MLAIRSSLRKQICLAIALGAAPAVLAQPGLGTAVIGIATGQSARVSALNLGSSNSNDATSCTVSMQFLDSQGKVLKEFQATLQAGKSSSLDLSRDELPGDQLRQQIRAVLLFGYSGGANPGPQVMQQYDCNIVPSLEVFDNATGRTSLLLTDSKPLPAPDPRSVASAGGRRAVTQDALPK